MPARLSIIIPAYNEADRIVPTLRKIRQFLRSENIDGEVIVVNDGSSDRTSELVREMIPLFAPPDMLQLLENDGNRGKGYSVRHGVLESRGALVLFTDSDLSSPIEEYRKLESAMTGESAEIALGSRALKQSRVEVHQPWLRELSGRSFNLFVRVFAGLPFLDTQCGFKLFTRQAAEELFRRQTIDGFGFDVEILYIAQKLGYRIVEVPVVWRDSGETRVSLGGGARAFAEVLRVRIRDIGGKYNHIITRGQRR